MFFSHKFLQIPPKFLRAICSHAQLRAFVSLLQRPDQRQMASSEFTIVAYSCTFPLDISYTIGVWNRSRVSLSTRWREVSRMGLLVGCAICLSGYRKKGFSEGGCRARVARRRGHRRRIAGEGGRRLSQRRVRERVETGARRSGPGGQQGQGLVGGSQGRGCCVS